VASKLKQIQGPIVLVAHSYGGAVISAAATQVSNVKALVYLDALGLEEGESKRRHCSALPQPWVPRRAATAVGPHRPTAPRAPSSSSTRQPSTRSSPPTYPARVAAVMASAQRALALAGDPGESTAPAWKTIPSWYVVGRQDQIFTAAAQRFMAKRANAHTIEINSSHASYISHPATVTKLILRAAQTVA